MEKPCEICLTITNPPEYQARHYRMVCVPCAKFLYGRLGREVGYSVNDWWSFADYNHPFSDAVNQMLTEICPQCRRIH
jgi:hypothetical protein